MTTTSGNHTQWPQQMTARTTTYQGPDVSSFPGAKRLLKCSQGIACIKTWSDWICQEMTKIMITASGRIESFKRYCIEIKKKKSKNVLFLPIWILDFEKFILTICDTRKSNSGLSQFFSPRSCILRLGTSLAFSPLVAVQEGSHDPLGLFFVIQSLVQSPRKG